MAKSSASRRLFHTITSTCVIFIVSVAIVCTAMPIELTEIYRGHNLTALAASNGTFKYDGDGYEVNCQVFPRKLPTTESPNEESAIANISNAANEFDRRTWDIQCSAVLSLANNPRNASCPDNMTLDHNGKCRLIGE